MNKPINIVPFLSFLNLVVSFWSCFSRFTEDFTRSLGHGVSSKRFKRNMVSLVWLNLGEGCMCVQPLCGFQAFQNKKLKSTSYNVR